MDEFDEIIAANFGPDLIPLGTFYSVEEALAAADRMEQGPA